VFVRYSNQPESEFFCSQAVSVHQSQREVSWGKN
jgi:hypothetical protein